MLDFYAIHPKQCHWSRLLQLLLDISLLHVLLTPLPQPTETLDDHCHLSHTVVQDFPQEAMSRPQRSHSCFGPTNSAIIYKEPMISGQRSAAYRQTSVLRKSHQHLPSPEVRRNQIIGWFGSTSAYITYTGWPRCHRVLLLCLADMCPRRCKYSQACSPVAQVIVACFITMVTILGSTHSNAMLYCRTR